MAIRDPLTGHPMLAFAGDWQQELDRLRAAMAASGWTAESPDYLDAEGEQIAREERWT